MFFVGDTRVQRLAMIRSYQGPETVVGALLAAIDFEWTLRRAIIAFGKSPNRVLHTRVLRQLHGPDKFKDIWQEEVCENTKNTNLKRLPQIVRNWSDFRKAYDLRHQLVHGSKFHSGTLYAATKRDVITTATDQLIAYCAANGVDIYKRLPVRRKHI